MGERLKEHKRATRLERELESGVAEHVCNTGHKIDWSAKILDQDQNQRRRLVREAIMIKKHQPSMNREQGFELSKAYSKIIHQEGSNSRPPGGGNSQVAPSD